MLSEYDKSKYWKDYIESLDGGMDDGIFGLCHYLTQRLAAAEQSTKAVQQEAPPVVLVHGTVSEQRLSALDWTCKACTFQNHSSWSKCYNCHAPHKQ